ncbi:Hypothetical_protein [Hexamita inflata]|uniref:Hypothetical_protein n=1 Tax=Hexamita inflata TaxID=28002 RepID=A0AA86QXX7_9EUKA|nr:Hypothetical protein HINF_LOCUS55731 [Hexamita inflata]
MRLRTGPITQQIQESNKKTPVNMYPLYCKIVRRPMRLTHNESLSASSCVNSQHQGVYTKLQKLCEQSYLHELQALMQFIQSQSSHLSHFELKKLSKLPLINILSYSSSNSQFLHEFVQIQREQFTVCTRNINELCACQEILIPNYFTPLFSSSLTNINQIVNNILLSAKNALLFKQMLNLLLNLINGVQILKLDVPFPLVVNKFAEIKTENSTRRQKTLELLKHELMHNALANEVQQVLVNEVEYIKEQIEIQCEADLIYGREAEGKRQNDVECFVQEIEYKM